MDTTGNGPWDFFLWAQALIKLLPREERIQFFKLVRERDPEAFQQWQESIVLD